MPGYVKMNAIVVDQAQRIGDMVYVLGRRK